jgi:hypothetical protein
MNQGMRNGQVTALTLRAGLSAVLEPVLILGNDQVDVGPSPTK